MTDKKALRALIVIWLGWFIVLYGFQALVTTRLGLQRPDHAVVWSATETLPSSNDGKIYLNEPSLNRQVAWDSEYYLGIAVGGYDDPAGGRVTNPATGQPVVKNYSFFPLYPYLMRGVMLPFTLLGMAPIAAASLAGVIVSLLGTLAGMVALWELTRAHLDEEGAFRSVFYLLIFPTAFFLAQVYTEGLFIGLAFWCLLFLKRKQWLWAGLAAVFAAWTRAHGAALALPIAVAWLMEFNFKKDLEKQITRQRVLQGLAALLPLGAYWLWRNSALGEGWAELQVFYFGRGLMTIEQSLSSWGQVYFYSRFQSPEGLIYFSLEVFTCALALVAAIWLLRRDPQVALFSLALVALSIFSGSAQSMARYMLVAPATYVFLAHLGRNKAFDRIWTLVSVLLMGMSVMLFSFDFWVG
jgi:hypothetical protein